jgi:Lantibiotic dehydratase, N terminus
MRRADALQELALRSLRERDLHVVIDATVLTRLEHHQINVDRIPPSIDLHICVLAEHAQDVDHGKFLIMIAPSLGAIGARRYLGRFAERQYEQEHSFFARTEPGMVRVNQTVTTTSARRGGQYPQTGERHQRV